jgi:hypothetical protein
MQKRRRFKQTVSLEQRLIDEASRLREEARSMRPCARRDSLIRKAHQLDTASHMSGWLNSAGLRPPT